MQRKSEKKEVRDKYEEEIVYPKFLVGPLRSKLWWSGAVEGIQDIAELSLQVK